MNTNETPIRELRRKRRGTLEYTSGCGEGGRAEWLNISRTGAALRLGRYLRPGRTLYLESPDGLPVRIPAAIAWCTPIPGSLDFRVGLRVLRADPEVALQFAILGQAGRENKRSLKTVHNAVWPASAIEATILPNAAAGHLTHAV
jgi:hypothetical protein